jgi:hypothetical protein
MPVTWTPEFDAFIRKNKHMTTAEIAKALGASPRDIRRHRAMMRKLVKRGKKANPCNSQRHNEWRPPGWTLDQGHPCPRCEHYPPNMVKDTCACTDCAARVEWYTQYL